MEILIRLPEETFDYEQEYEYEYEIKKFNSIVGN